MAARAEDSGARARGKVESPTGEEWKDAEAKAATRVGARYRGLPAERAEEIAREAVEESAQVWRREAKLSTLATTIALRKAAKLARREIRAKAPPKPRPRREPKPRETAALGPMLERFLAHERRMLTPAIWRLGPGERLVTAIRGIPALYELHAVPPSMRLALEIRDQVAFVTDVNAYARKVRRLGEHGWVRSAETLDARIRVAGKPRRDPFLEGDHGPELQATFLVARRTNSALAFKAKANDAANAVIRYALHLAGIPRTLLNALLAAKRWGRRRRRTVAKKIASAI